MTEEERISGTKICGDGAPRGCFTATESVLEYKTLLCRYPNKCKVIVLQGSMIAVVLTRVEKIRNIDYKVRFS